MKLFHFLIERKHSKKENFPYLAFNNGLCCHDEVFVDFGGNSETLINKVDNLSVCVFTIACSNSRHLEVSHEAECKGKNQDERVTVEAKVLEIFS